MSGAADDPTGVVAAYFAAIGSRDVEALRLLFATDAVLITLAGTVHGPDEICAFYRDSAFGADDLDPRPGPMLVDGSRVAVEIELQMNAHVTRIADVFTVEDDKITRLAVYLGPPTS